MSIRALLTISFLFFSALVDASISFRGPHTFSAGPEFYWAKRTRPGGTALDGFMYGGYLSYERVRRCALYWGVDYSVAYGKLEGKSADRSRQKSWLLDETVEGRLGYTYGTKRWKRPYITPFLGYGYFYQTNRFVSPSPLLVKFRNTFPYACCGFQAGFRFSPSLKLGVLAKGKWMIDGRHRITGDSQFDNITLSMEEKWQYEIELPFDYIRSDERCFINFRIVPFFRLRHYGEKMDFPFDFVETKYRNWGIRALVTYAF